MRRALTTFMLLLSSPLFANTIPTEEFTLANGLKVLVREDHRSPVATVQLWYKIGSSYEHNGNTGLSHLLEHMMFQGTKAFPEGKFDSLILGAGGELNAFTSYDFTGYYESLPANQLEIAFQLEADRMRNIDFSRASFDRELQVVIEERRMRVDDNPQQLAYERFQGVAFLTSPYRNPVIGWGPDIRQLSYDSAFDWYNRWYYPNNATLIVVGDVDPKAIRSMAEKYFGAIPHKTITPTFSTPELPSLGERRMDIGVNITLPELFMSMTVPSYTSATEQDDAIVMALLTQILDGGLSARFETSLVRNQNLASTISTSYSPFTRLSSGFEIDAVPQKGVTLDALEKAIWDEITALTTTPVTKEELARAKMRFKADYVFGQDDIANQAMEIGSLESIGLSYQDKEAFLKAIEKIDANDVQTVAKRYLTRENTTVARLIPTPPAHQEPTL
ncbi:MAG: M16 family metallopeptidase [Gammaproteobacteria bacterium]